ncbi:MAG: hypothetical protein KME13_25010 [Myxacorys californica WJT36-NPBG1]|jgi:hypothetical protein|nr:hypothetical protein [Myxacorys californica WJT36-NPBG1]
MTIQHMPNTGELNRTHIGLGIAVGVLGILCATSSLTSGQKSGGMLLSSLFSAGIGAASFAFTIKASQIVEKREGVAERFRLQEENIAYMQNETIAQAKVQKLQLHAGAKLQVDEVIAEDDARRYYAEYLGVDPDDMEIDLDEDEEEEPEAKPPASQSAPVQPAPVIEQPSPPVTPVATPGPLPAPVQPAPVIEQPSPVAQLPIEQPGICQALDEIVVSDISTVFASATGTGKSVSEAYILNRMFAKYPNLEAWVIAQKNDSFCGLREKGRTSLFDPLNPLLAFGAIDEVYNIFDARRHMPESARSSFKDQPVRLILSDWHSIWDTCREEKWYKTNFSKKLSTLVTVGREMNVCLLVDTQSYNVASLGITEDSNIRSNLNILCQGYSWIDEQGRQRGDFNMIRNLMKNRYLVPVDSDSLIEQLERLKARSMEAKTPIIFSTIGSKLQLLPDLKSFKAVM